VRGANGLVAFTDEDQVGVPAVMHKIARDIEKDTNKAFKDFAERYGKLLGSVT